MAQVDDTVFCNHDTADLISPPTPDDAHRDNNDEDTVIAPLPPTVEISSEDSTDPMASSSIRIVEPRDRGNIIYISLLMAGIGFLLPYNSFITAVDYFLDKYPGSTIVFDMSLTYIVVAFVAVILNNALVESFSLHVRVTFGYIVALLALSFVAILEVGLEIFSAGTSYFVILAAVATVSLGCTVQQSSFYGYAGMLPRRFTQAVMTGESAAGLITSINRIVTKLLVHDEKINTLTFFVLSAIMVLVCLVTYHLARKTDFVRYYMVACTRDGYDEHPQLNQYDRLTNENDEVPTENMGDNHSPMDTNIQQGSGGRNRAPPIGVFGEENSFEIEFPVPSQYERFLSKARAVKRGIRSRLEISRTLWPYMLSIALAYFVTLCLFPGIESEVVSCSLRGWMPVILMAIFNATDFCGKIIGAVPYNWSPRKLVVAEMSRLAIIPLMLLCVAPRANPILPHEAWSMLLSGILGITNGYFGSIPMIMAPAKVTESRKELAGNIMTLSYNVGLTTGSATAYLLNYLLGASPSVSCVVPVTGNTSHYPH
ncbi:equilibrative nucleoside transporter 4-like isoform X1 [Asterias rubens]|uniref:equilibrative nucleoside transporter 4-like isoform X1 n=1 Tax=Asterias rubens TaxID=7604 RepID=UPI001455086D|nr:equilibrative nucleoside transporter 4-like isoform X1 [Asterias rubens]XP_033631142.1 equilibrative nucleoside transporter 4-like isoform X1 [Asterias rubens]